MQYCFVAAWRRCGNNLSPWERIESRLCSKRYRGLGAAQGQMLGREEGRRNSEDEQEQDTASQQLTLLASSGCNEGTPASSLELDLHRVRGAFGECGGAGSQVQQRMSEKDLHQPPSPPPSPQVDFPLMRKKMWQCETCEVERVEGTSY